VSAFTKIEHQEMLHFENSLP